MKTFILEWNPEISSYRMEDFENDLHYIEYGEFNWSVWDWRSARSGDNFYMIRCSGERNGIVMKGFFTSDPYEADDWSGKGREVHYMDFRPVVMVHPETGRMLGVEALEAAMPDFLWNGGHSGRELPEELRSALDSMWEEYISQFSPEDFDIGKVSFNETPVAIVDDALQIATGVYYGRTDGNGRPVITDILSEALKEPDEDGISRVLLKDIIGMDGYSAGELRERGFSEEFVDSLLSD